MATIHPTAIIESGAELAPTVEVGAYAYVGSLVKLGEGCRLHHHAVVEGNTSLQQGNEIFPFAYVGGKTQDLKYRGGQPALRIGAHNVFREFSTVHCATTEETATVIGDHNHFLAYAHVAHECQLKDHIIVSSNALIGGHVEIDSFANIGGGSAIHQFCKVGQFALIGGGSALVQDLLPFMIAEGNRARVRNYNRIGLERQNIEPEKIEQIRKIFKLLYMDNLNRTQAFERMAEDMTISEDLKMIFREFRQKSTRGLA